MTGWSTTLKVIGSLTVCVTVKLNGAKGVEGCSSKGNQLTGCSCVDGILAAFKCL